MLGQGFVLVRASAVPGPMQYEAPYGNVLIGLRMAASRHMHEYGTTSAAREIAVACAVTQVNPNALYRDQIR